MVRDKRVKYVNTLRSREFKIHEKDLLDMLGLPQENVVDLYYNAGYLKIITDSTVKEKRV